MRRLTEGEYATSNITHGPLNDVEGEQQLQVEKKTLDDLVEDSALHPLIELSRDVRVVASEGTDIWTLFCMTKQSMAHWCGKDEDSKLYHEDVLFGKVKRLAFWSSSIDKQEVNDI